MIEARQNPADTQFWQRDAEHPDYIRLANGQLAYCPPDRDHGVPINRLAALIAENEAKFAAVRVAVLTADCGDVLDAGDGPLIVNHVSYAKGTPIEAVLDDTAVAEMVVLTADGRHALYQEWHEGPPTDDEWVRYERWTAEGRVAHGYIDTVTRKLVQTG